MRVIRRLALLMAGVGLFSFALHRIGAGRVVHEVMAIGAGFIVILALSLIRLLLQTRSWAIALQRDGIDSSTTELIFLRLASQGIGYLTVLGPAASEPMKIKLLEGRKRSAAAATLVDTGLYWISAGVVLIAGCITAAFALMGRHSTSAPLAAVAAAVGAGIYFMSRPKPLLAGKVLSVGSRAPAWLRKVAQVEIDIRRFACEHPGAIRQMLLLDLACQLLLLAEVATGLYFMHFPVRLTTVLSIEAAGRASRIVGGWMPARIGADESGAAAAFVCLGLPSAGGVALALVRRVRDMANSLAGLAWIAWRTRKGEQAVDSSLAAASPLLTGAVQCKLY